MKKISLFSILGLTILSLTGCWGNTESFNSLIMKNNMNNSADINFGTSTNIVEEPKDISIEMPQDIEEPDQELTNNLDVNISTNNFNKEITEDYDYSNYIEKEGTLKVSSIKTINLNSDNDNIIPVKYVEGVLEDGVDFTTHNISFNLSVFDNISEDNNYKVSYKCLEDYDNNIYVIMDIKLLTDNSNNYESFTEPDLNTDEIINTQQEEIQENTTIEEPQIVQETQSINTNTYNVIDGVNVRDKGSTKGKVIGKLSAGEQIEVIELSSNGSWAKFNYNGQEAWVSTKYIKKGN